MNQMFHIMINYCIIIILTTGLIRAAPAPKTNEYTMLDAVLIQCPNLKDNIKFKEQSVFKTCNNNWTVITNTSILDFNTMDKVLCLLYYDTVIESCKQDNLLTLDEDISKFTPEIDVCKNFTRILHSRTFQHNLSALITDEYKCTVLCYGYNKTLNEICRYSYFFASYDIKKMHESTNKPVPSGSNQQILRSSQLIIPNQSNSTIKKLDDVEKQQQPNSVSNLTAVAVEESDLKKPVEALNNAAPKETIVELKPEVPSKSKKKPDVVKPPVDLKETPKQVLPPAEEVQVPALKETPKQVLPPAEEVQVPANVDSTAPKQSDIGNDEANNIDSAVDIEFSDGQQEQEAEMETPEKYTQPEKKNEKPSTLDDEPVNIMNNNNTEYDMNGDSYFLSYFTVAVCLFFVGYVGYHNRQKIFALLLEGKKRPRQNRVGRRPNSANYHKLDSNLEEAISSSCNKSTSHVIY